MPKKNTQEFWNRIENARAGMLEADDAFVPMTHYSDPEHSLLWFICSKDSFVYQQVPQQGIQRRYIISDESSGLYAQVRGTLSDSHDRNKLNDLWNLVSSAYYPDGPRSSHVGLLRFRPISADAWFTTSSTCVFLAQIAKAKVTGARPALGKRAELDFE